MDGAGAGGAVQVVGAGGIGCAVGYALRAAGLSVTLVEVNRAKVAAGRRDGLRLDAHPPLPAEFVPFADWQPPPGTPVFLCVKCYDNAGVLARLPAGCELVPVQNGFDPQLEEFGHAVEGIASFVARCPKDQPHARITRRGDLHFGPRLGRATPPPVWLAPLREVARRLGRFRVRWLDDVRPVKHTKLLYNAAISPLAAAAGLDNGELLSVPVARRLFFALLRENYRILTAAGRPLGRVGPLHPHTVAQVLRRQWLARLLARCFEPSLRGTYCSMAGEIATGRTELPNYTGYLLRLAEQSGTPAPLNRAVYDVVSRLTAEHAEPRRDVLEEMASHVRDELDPVG